MSRAKNEVKIIHLDIIGDQFWEQNAGLLLS